MIGAALPESSSPPSCRDQSEPFPTPVHSRQSGKSQPTFGSRPWIDRATGRTNCIQRVLLCFLAQYPLGLTFIPLALHHFSRAFGVAPSSSATTLTGRFSTMAWRTLSGGYSTLVRRWIGNSKPPFCRSTGKASGDCQAFRFRDAGPRPASWPCP